MKTLTKWLAAATIVGLAGAAQAGLVSLGDGTVKDTNTNLIWLQNWNVNGAKDWDTQKAWAEGLDFAGSTDWRLPEIGEYVALFAAYGDLSKKSEVTNVQFDYYWSGTEAASDPSYVQVLFPMEGFQVNGYKANRLYAVAVRPSDVTASVPEPQTLALALLALGATVVTRKRRLS